MSWNHVVIEGRILEEPEHRSSLSGSPVTVLRVSAARGKPGSCEDGECWAEVVCFGTLADNAAASLRRGDRVVVTGRLSRRSWESQGGGGSILSVRASDVAASLRRATAVLTATDPADACLTSG